MSFSTPASIRFSKLNKKNLSLVSQEPIHKNRKTPKNCECNELDNLKLNPKGELKLLKKYLTWIIHVFIYSS